MAVKKTTQKEGSSWIGEVEKYSRKIWLAGLGVYSKVSSDGGKYFETLVKDGEKAEKLTKSTVGKKSRGGKSERRFCEIEHFGYLGQVGRDFRQASQQCYFAIGRAQQSGTEDAAQQGRYPDQANRKTHRCQSGPG